MLFFKQKIQHANLNLLLKRRVNISYVAGDRNYSIFSASAGLIPVALNA